VEVSHTGNLLVATPQLIDPNFYRAVVLILQHDEEGSVGVVLNRPTLERVGNHLPEWEKATREGLVFAGGPVEPEVAIGISSSMSGEPTGVAGLSMVDLTQEPEESQGLTQVYSGYSGWGPGQMEDELEMGSWYVIQASPDDPFANHEALWRDVLRRQGGHLSVVSTFSDEPELN